MAAGYIAGALHITDSERTYLTDVNTEVVMETMTDVVDSHNQQLEAAFGVFVDRSTEKGKFNHRPSYRADFAKTRGRNRPEAIVPIPGYDVAIGLDGYEVQLLGSKRDMAKMTVRDLDRAFSSILQADGHNHKVEVMTALFTNTDRVINDEDLGTITVKPLANGDAYLYPAYELSVDGAVTDNHYLASGYTVANISASNDPFDVIIPELDEHFTAVRGVSNVALFGNGTVINKILATFPTNIAKSDDPFVVRSAQEDRAVGSGITLGRVRGRHDKGAWLVEWKDVPANYVIAVNLDADKPLYRRIDPQYVQSVSPVGLHFAKGPYTVSPLEDITFQNFFGYGVVNRLNGVIMHFTVSSYAIPTFS